MLCVTSVVSVTLTWLDFGAPAVVGETSTSGSSAVLEVTF